MIISHKYKYLFVELPRTGSTSISKTLCDHYSGKEIISKHAKYTDFLKKANNNEKKYYIFSCIRNPLWRVITEYEKLKNDRMNKHLSFTEWLPKLKKINYFKYIYIKRRFNFVQKHKDFLKFFSKFYKLPYDDWSSLNHRHFDYIIRFETLEYDFSYVLKTLNINKTKNLDILNKTESKRNSLEYYFNNKFIIKKALQKFGPFMEQWKYDFPEHWKIYYRLSKIDRLFFSLISIIKKLLWKYISFRNHKKQNYEY